MESVRKFVARVGCVLVARARPRRAARGAKAERPLEPHHLAWLRSATAARKLLIWSLKAHKHLLSFPHYTRQFVDQLKQSMGAQISNKEELTLYESHTRDHSLELKLVAALHLLIALKLMVPIVYTMGSVDLSNPLASLWAENSSARSDGLAYRFLCLATNCSRLTARPTLSGASSALRSNGADNQPQRQHQQESLLAEDLARLPVFAICMSHLKWLANPVVYTQNFGLTTNSALAFFVLVMSCLTPIYATWLAMPLGLLMDVLCPEIAAWLARDRIRNHLGALLMSLANFKDSRRSQHLRTAPHDTRSGALGDNLRLPATSRRRQAEVDCLQAACIQARRSFEHLERGLPSQAESFIDDCLPIQLTEWFRVNWTQTNLLATAIGFIALFASYSTFWLWLVTNQSYIELYRSFGRQMALDGCALWKVSGASGGRALVDLHDIVSGWAAWQAAEFFFAPALAILIIAVATSLYYHCMQYLNLLVVDLDNQLKVIVEVAELLNAAAAAAALTDHERPESGTRQTSRMRLIRERLYELVHPNFLLLRSNQPRRLNGRRIKGALDERLASQEFARFLISGHFCSDTYVDLLAKLHINYWLFMDAFKQFHGPVTLCLASSYTLNYGFALIGLYLFRSFKEFIKVPLVMIGLSLLIANGFIALSSNVHAKAKRLESKWWSLIAATTHCEDERVCHLRHLWAKQLELIDATGGLSLKIFKRVRVTYASIIEYAIWTASILLLASMRNL